MDKLDLNKNILTDYYFSNLRFLKQLSIDYNNLASLNQFNDLHGLAELSLYNNKLKVLPSYGLNFTTYLKSFFAEHNLINKIEEHAFAGTEKALTYLQLAHNKLEFILSHYFAGLAKLEILILKHNFISSISPLAFVDLVNLKELYLNENCLFKIDQNDFKSLLNLKRLNLSHNELYSLGENSFSTLSQLQYLSLSFNLLKELPQNVFKVQKIYFKLIL